MAKHGNGRKLQLVMGELTLFQGLRKKWLQAVSARLTKSNPFFAIVEDDLSVMFDQLLKALETGNPMWIEDTIQAWASTASEARPLTESTGVVKIIGEILDATMITVSAELPPEESILAIKMVLPVFVHGMDFAANRELSARLDKMQRELGKAKSVIERVEKSKTDFISVAAHELRTPLTLIEGYTSMLHDVLPSADVQRLQSALCIKGINTGTKRLREIVDDMIDVSMIENNLLTLNFQPIWINRICSAVQRELNESITLRHQVFCIKDFPGSNEMIFADGERIYQALRNIISNAVKYTPDGGKITVDGRLLPGFIEVVVIDTGIGIDQENHQRIFEKFGNLGDASLHSSGKTKFKGGGPGLGLPITKGIIEAHGGAIWVESEGYDEIECPGSVFHMMIPLRKKPPDQNFASFFDT